MQYYQVLLFFLVMIVSIRATHYRGGSLSWTIRENSTLSSSSQVALRISQRHSYKRSYNQNVFCNQTTINQKKSIGDGTVDCAGSCSGVSKNNVKFTISSLSTLVPCTDFDVEFDYSSGEGCTDLVVPADIRFSFVINGCCWIPLLPNVTNGKWSLEVVVNTNRRRDGNFNNSPKTASNPVVQVQVGKTHVIPIPMADSDGDLVRCRWGKTITECGGICPHKGILQAFPCQLTYEAKTIGYEGVALVIEDFDLVTNQSYSAIPLQFLIQVVNQTLTTTESGVDNTTQPCPIPPVFVGDRQHGACIGVASNTTITERLVVEIPCNQSSTTLDDILTISLPGMTRSSIERDPFDNNTYFMSVEWTPQPDQYGIHQLCLQPVDSSSQVGQQACYTFQVDILPPQFIPGSMSPAGVVLQNQSIWSIKTDRDMIRPTRSGIFIRFFKQLFDGVDEEVLRIDGTSSDVIYQPRDITFVTNNIQWEEGEYYYILLDSGIAMINQSCGVESAPIKNPDFWEFHIPAATTTTTTVSTTTTYEVTTQPPTTTITVTTTQPPTTTTATTTTTGNPLPPSICPIWLSWNTVINVTTSLAQPNYTFCFTVNMHIADVTIEANTWSPCSTWKLSGAADPFIELFTPATNTNSPVAQNDDGNNIENLNCYAAVLSYRLMRGHHRVVVRHQKCAYGSFELRFLGETTNELIRTASADKTN